MILCDSKFNIIEAKSSQDCNIRFNYHQSHKQFEAGDYYVFCEVEDD